MSILLKISLLLFREKSEGVSSEIKWKSFIKTHSNLFSEKKRIWCGANTNIVWGSTSIRTKVLNMTKIEIIEKKRVEMIKLISVCASLTDNRVVTVSQQLDRLLNEYTMSKTE